MNINKPYSSQNRVRKRKKNVDCFLSERKENSVEEERQFKLRRFVKDVNKFVEEKENTSNKNNMCKETAPRKAQKQLKKTIPTKLLGKTGLFQNGIHTRFCNRGLWGKEKTARLEENLQQIIGLSNKKNDCQCLHQHCQQSAPHPTDAFSVKHERKPLQPLFPRISPHSSQWKSSPSPQSVGGEAIADNPKPRPDLDEVANKLYPEFARIITIASTESKSKHFRQKSYVTEVKKKLLDIYLRGKKNTQETSCSVVSDVQRSSVATSTSPQGNHSSPSEAVMVAHSNSSPFSLSEPPFEMNFVQDNCKSHGQFMEETIGPVSSCTTNALCSQALEERHNPFSLPPLVRYNPVPSPDLSRHNLVSSPPLSRHNPISSPPLVRHNPVPSPVLSRHNPVSSPPLSRHNPISSSPLVRHNPVLSPVLSRHIPVLSPRLSRHNLVPSPVHSRHKRVSFSYFERQTPVSSPPLASHIPVPSPHCVRHNSVTSPLLSRHNPVLFPYFAKQNPVLSPSLARHSRDFGTGRTREKQNSNTPLHYQFSRFSPISNHRSMLNDAGRDHHNSFVPFNNFLPSIEEESPEFQYFPRRMF